MTGTTPTNVLDVTVMTRTVPRGTCSSSRRPVPRFQARP